MGDHLVRPQEEQIIKLRLFGADNRGSTRLPLKVRWEDWDNARNEGHPDNPLLVMVE